MIKHSILVVILMSLFALPVLPKEFTGFRGGYWAFSTKELPGFRGHLWGSSIPLSWRLGIRYEENGLYVFPKNILFRNKIGAAYVSCINYIFYKNKLYCISFHSNNSISLLEALETKLGPIKWGKKDYDWEGHEYKAEYHSTEEGAYVKIWSPTIDRFIQLDKIKANRSKERKKYLKTVEETKNAVNDF